MSINNFELQNQWMLINHDSYQYINNSMHFKSEGYKYKKE